MTTRPEHSTCPKWAARLAREQALEEAATLAEATHDKARDLMAMHLRAADLENAFKSNVRSEEAARLCLSIRALKTKEPA